MAQDGQVLGSEEHLDAARHPRPAADEPEALQREHHLVHGWLADPEAALDVALGRRTAGHAGVGIDEGQVLTLPVGEGGQCLDRRIDNRAELEREIAAWERARNTAGARVNWMFTTEKARTKMGRAYPKPTAALDQPVNES